MKTNQNLVKFRQKCISKLKREDAEFFLDRSTLKDMALCGTIMRMKNIRFEDEFEFEMWVVRYLQIMMILSSISDDHRDKKLVARYLEVPFDCEDIVKGKVPYKNALQFDATCLLIKNKYPLPLYWDFGGQDTDLLLATTPKDLLPMMNNILDYYSTPIVGVVAMMGMKPRDFCFLQELKLLLGYVMDRHYRIKKDLTPEEESYVKAMKFVTNFKSRTLRLA